MLAPTREIALQVADALAALGAGLPAPGLAVGAFIGGLPTEEDVRRLRRCAAGGGLARGARCRPGGCAPAAGQPAGVALAPPLLMARMTDGMQGQLQGAQPGACVRLAFPSTGRGGSAGRHVGQLRASAERPAVPARQCLGRG